MKKCIQQWLFFCPMDKKMIAPYIECCFGKNMDFAQLSSNLAHGPKVYAYHAVI